MNSCNFAEFREEGLDVILGGGGGQVRNSDGGHFVGKAAGESSSWRNVFAASCILDTDTWDVLMDASD